MKAYLDVKFGSRNRKGLSRRDRSRSLSVGVLPVLSVLSVLSVLLCFVVSNSLVSVEGESILVELADVCCSAVSIFCF